MKFVYFIKPVGMLGPIKIGCTGATYKRKAALQAMSPFRLEVVAELCGGRMVEKQFHDLFSDSRSHGEWFHWSKPLQKVIDDIRAGLFDFGALPPIRANSFSDKWDAREYPAAFMAAYQPSTPHQSAA